MPLIPNKLITDIKRALDKSAVNGRKDKAIESKIRYDLAVDIAMAIDAYIRNADVVTDTLGVGVTPAGQPVVSATAAGPALGSTTSPITGTTKGSGRGKIV